MHRIITSLLLLAPASLLIQAQPKINPDAAAMAKLSPAQRARLIKKTDKISKRAFDSPDLAQDFYAASRTGPLRTRSGSQAPAPLDPARYLPLLKQAKAMPGFSTSTGATLSTIPAAFAAPAAAPGAALTGWTNLGPANQGGRTRALLIDPTNPSIMYAGGVDGGVWKSTDAGANWATTTDLNMPNLAVVTLAFDPRNTSTLYAGTGEGFRNIDAVRGAGIFKSTDAGLTFTQLASTNNTNFLYTMKVIVSPRNSKRIYAATRTGLFRSIDSGATFAPVASVSVVGGGCTDMAIQEKRTLGYIFVSCGTTSAQGTVYRGLDSDTGTFTSVLSLAGQGRSSIAVAPSNESVVYVLSAQSTSGGGPGAYGLHGVYRSTTNGNAGSFTTQRQGNTAPANTAQKINQLLLSNPVIGLLTECGFGSSSFANQGWYDNVISIDPLDSDRVWVGGIDLWRSDNGGVDWGTASYWWFDNGIDPQYSHADQHAIVFHPNYNGSSNKIMFVGSDGGVSRVDDARAPVNTTLTAICGSPVSGSPAWTDRNNNYVTTQFYDGSVYPDGNTFFGGLQDNGTIRGFAGNPNWSVLTGGDGGYTAVNTLGDAIPGNDVLFAEYTGKSMMRSTNGGASFADITSTITGSGFLFIAPFTMNLGTKTQLWTGGFDIWRTTNQGTSWSRATGAVGTCGLGAISAIAAHPLDGNRVLVGMSDGCFHYNHAALSAPNSGMWPGGGTIASGYISWMAWDPNNINVAYATVSLFGVNNLLKSTDGGATWAPSVGAGLTALPAVPALTVVVNPADSNQVFVGTDIGVFTSIDAGASWYRENTTFANVSVEALKINETAPHKLYAFTHGRGAWVTNIAQ